MERKSIKLNSFVNLAMQFIQIAFSLIFTPLIINNIGDEGYGLWTLFVTILGFESLLTFGLQKSLERYIPFYIGKGTKFELSSFISTNFTVITLWSVFASVIFYVLKDFFKVQLNIPLDQYASFDASIIYIVLTFVISAVSIPIKALMVGREEFVLINIFNFIQNASKFLLVFTFFNLGFLDVSYIAISNLLSVLIVILLYVFFTLRNKDIHHFHIKNFKKKSLVVSLTFGSGAILSYIADFMRYQVDSLLITKYVDIVSLSYYRIGTVYLTSLYSVIVGLFAVFLSRFSLLTGQEKDERAKDLLYGGYFISSFISIVILVGSIFLVEDFLKIWLGKYSQVSLNIIFVLLVPYVLGMIQYPSINYFYSQNKHHLLGKVIFLEGVVNLSISLALIKSHGALGAAIGTSVSMLIFKGIVSYLLLKKIFKFKISKFLYMMSPNVGAGIIVFSITFLLLKYVSFNYVILKFFVVGSFIVISYYLCVYMIAKKMNFQFFYLIDIKEYLKKIKS